MMKWSLLIGAGLVLAACGSSGKPTTTASSGDPTLKFAQLQISACMG
jgi:uncharacterized lipoprotein YmbA